MGLARGPLLLRAAPSTPLYFGDRNDGRPAAQAALSKWASSPLFFRKLLKLALEGEQVKTDEPAAIQAEVGEHLGELEHLDVGLLGGGRARILRIFLDRPG